MAGRGGVALFLEKEVADGEGNQPGEDHSQAGIQTDLQKGEQRRTTARTAPDG
jgi:hypothetical protein